MRFNISRKIIMVSALGIIASCLLTLVIGSVLTTRLFNDSLYNDMHAMQSLVASMVDDEERQLKQTVQILATIPEFIDAVADNDVDRVKENAVFMKNRFEYDLVTITDSDGIVLARGHSDLYMDDISGRSMMAKAMAGEVSTGVFYDPTAVIQLSIRAFSPIYKDGIFVGVIGIGTNIASEAYVDQIHNITSMNFSIFYGDTHLMTSIRDEDGDRIVGTVHEDDMVSFRVLHRGEVVIARYDVTGDPSMVALWPLRDTDSGRVIGMWGIGMSITEQMDGMNNVIMAIVTSSLAVIAIFALLSGLIGNRIAQPIRKATNYAIQVSAGDLDFPLDLPVKKHSKDEVRFLVDALKTMVTTLKIHISEAKDLNDRILLEVEETKRLIKEVEHQRIAAEKANKTKSYFLSTMSHEIRTPMNAVLGITEIQLMNDSLNPEIRKDFEQIYNAGYLLLSIINDILDLSKIEAGKMEISQGNYDVASVLSDTAQLNILRRGSKLITFELDVDESVPATLFGDGLRVRQVLNNLLSNAFKYTDKGKIKMSVWVSEVKAPDQESTSNGVINGDDYADNNNEDMVMLSFSVSDTGRGMSQEQLETLFEDYTRFGVEPSYSIEGSGLGMSITNNLINLMHGGIFVESVLGKGSVFTVQIPQRRVGKDTLGRDIVENLRMFRTIRGASKRRAQIVFEAMPYGSILIVDDVEVNIYVAKGLLAPYEVNIDAADGGQAAIEKVKSGKLYDIIFMDHMMPDMDGVEATKIIRELGYKNPIVALTANAITGQVDMFLSNGFDDFVSKPIDIRQLNIVMNKYIRDRHPADVRALTQAHSVEHKKMEKLVNKNIKGLDIVRGVNRYHGDEDAYMKVLHSYSISTEGMLQFIENTNVDNIASYRIKVHGIKGASYDIYAEQIAKRFEKLEKAAVSEDVEYISKNNTPAIESARKLLTKVNDLLKKVKEENPSTESKPKRDIIDDYLLTELSAACKNYDVSAAEMAMEEIEMYEYETDKELSVWLRENVDLINFAEVVERLDGLHFA
ncbi:MAG: ATP-binding protein [Oscillospiraceae bacterium]|nr:ATP-binding protein [Oscillospiraceae bacterium]